MKSIDIRRTLHNKKIRGVRIKDRTSRSAIYEHLTNPIRGATKKELEVMKERRDHIKETWWNTRKMCFKK